MDMSFGHLIARPDLSGLAGIVLVLSVLAFPLSILMPPSCLTPLGIVLLWLNVTISTAAAKRVITSKIMKGPAAVLAGIPALSVWLVCWCGINLLSTVLFWNLVDRF